MKVPNERLDFLSGGGEAGKLIRSKDWSLTPLGDPRSWSPSLRTVVRLMLTTNHPVFVFWGDDLTCLYNDAYTRSVGPEKHPGGLGARGRELWDEIWDIIGPQIEFVMSGEGATWNENHLVPITRHGKKEDVYWTYSYSPIDDPSAPNGVGGVLVLCTETTALVLEEQRKSAAAEEATSRLQEVLHRIKNNIAAITSMIKLEIRKIEDENVAAPLIRISSRLNNFSTLYTLMLAARERDTIEIGAYLDRLCEATTEIVSGGCDAEIACAFKADSCEKSSEDAFHLGAILVELLTNAYRHAFHGRKKGSVKVELIRSDESLKLIVADDGIGVKAAALTRNSSTGIGSLLVENYTEKLGGTLETISDCEGTRHILIAPMR